MGGHIGEATDDAAGKRKAAGGWKVSTRWSRVFDALMGQGRPANLADLVAIGGRLPEQSAKIFNRSANTGDMKAGDRIRTADVQLGKQAAPSNIIRCCRTKERS